MCCVFMVAKLSVKPVLSADFGFQLSFAENETDRNLLRKKEGSRRKLGLRNKGPLPRTRLIIIYLLFMSSLERETRARKLGRRKDKCFETYDQTLVFST